VSPPLQSNPQFSSSANLELNLGLDALPPRKIQERSAPVVTTEMPGQSLADQLARFCEFGEATRTLVTSIETESRKHHVPTFVNEFWTARQRQANSLHEISYRACFKPQLPRFFIARLTQPGDAVYDPFMGRGTTPVEAALLGRIPSGNDINPLSVLMTAPRLRPPTLSDIAKRVSEIDLSDAGEMPEELLVFYHPDTLRGISALRKYFKQQRASGGFDSIDAWLEMVSLNRLTGHSPGFFSVYTLPPNQAVSVKSQLKINAKRNQVPPPRDVTAILLKKSKQLLSDCTPEVRRMLSSVADSARLLTSPAAATRDLASESITLVVTSPPFLDIVQYATDNWLRCWFADIDPDNVSITTPKKIGVWQAAMTDVFRELQRVLKPGGHVAFEVGEVHGGATRLEEAVLPCGLAAGLEPLLIMINDQQFTKTANCWGVDNMSKGTNTNRIVVFRKRS